MHRRFAIVLTTLLVSLPAPFVWAQSAPAPEAQRIYLRTLDHAQADVLADVLADLVPICGTLADCSSSNREAAVSRLGYDDRSNQLLVRTSEGRIGAIDELIAGLDVPTPEPELEWTEIQVDAEDVEALQYVLSRLARVCGTNNAVDCAAESPVILQLVTLAVDERSRRVFALGHPHEVAELRDLVELVQ